MSGQVVSDDSDTRSAATETRLPIELAVSAWHEQRAVIYKRLITEELAAELLEFGMKHLGLVAGAIGPMIEGKELSSAWFDPFWAISQPRSGDGNRGCTKRACPRQLTRAPRIRNWTKQLP